jgi:uncharacterized membrane protein
VSLPLLAFLITGGIFVAMDFAWLATMSGHLYRPQLGALMRDQIALAPSALFYIVYAAVLSAVVVLPAYNADDPSRALVTGLLVGLAAYATYNLTNAATLNGWPPLLTIVDWAWGTVATALAAWLSVFALIYLRH